MAPPQPHSPKSRFRGIRTAGVAILAALALTSTGCAAGGYGASAADQETFTHVTYRAVMTDWDPASAYSTEVIALQNMYESLTRYDPKTKKVEPVLATDWKKTKDGKTWVFNLREGVKFHSGKAMDAKAAKAALDDIIKKGEAAAYLWAAVDKIEVTGDHQLTFKLSIPAPLDLVTSSAYSAYIYEVPKSKKDFEAKSFGTGPYTVEKWKAGVEKELTLTAFDDYWGGWEGNKFKKVDYRVVPQASTAAKMIESGEAQYVDNLSPSLRDGLRTNESLKFPTSDSWQNAFAQLNTKKPPLDDKRMRQAISYAINYDELIEVTEGAWAESSGVIPKGLMGYEEDPGLPIYDPDKAEDLLGDLGYGPKGEKDLKLTLTYEEGNDSFAQMATVMQSQLATVGIELDIQGMPTETGMRPKAQSKDVNKQQDIALVVWWPDDPEPLSWYDGLYKTEEEMYFNYSYYSNPELDKIVGQVSQATATDPDKAVKMYGEMQDMLLRDVPSIFVGVQTYQRTISADISGFKDNPLYSNVVFAHDLSYGNA